MNLVDQAIKRCEEQKIRILSRSSPDWAESVAFEPAATRLLLAFLHGDTNAQRKELLLFCKPHRARRDQSLRDLAQRAAEVATKRRR